MIARNADPNETSAYDFAEEVYEGLEERDYNNVLETRTVSPLSSYVIQSDSTAVDFESAKDQIIKGRWEGNITEKHPEAEIFSLHNYPLESTEIDGIAGMQLLTQMTGRKSV